MAADFIAKRIASLTEFVKGHDGVIIDHDFQDGHLVSIFSKRKDDNVIKESLKSIQFRINDDYQCGPDLEYADSDGGYFVGFRLKKDMETLGYNWVLTFRPEFDCINVPSIFTVPRYRAKETGEEIGSLFKMTSSSSSVATALFENIAKDLISYARFIRYKESDLYHVIGSSGTVPTDHPRVCQVAQGMYVSHPLCKKCGKHTGSCRHYSEYEDAVKWADDKNTRCWGCISNSEKKRIEKMTEEDSDYEDYGDGCGCSCPISAGGQ